MRVSNWPSQYHRAVSTARLLPFQWGLHDCVTFVAYVVDQISDLDVTSKFRLKYRWHTVEEAALIIAGAGGLTGLVNEFLGPPIPWAMTGTGDVVLARNDEREVLCMNDGHNLLTTADLGLSSLPMTYGLRGWRI